MKQKMHQSDTNGCLATAVTNDHSDDDAALDQVLPYFIFLISLFSSVASFVLHGTDLYIVCLSFLLLILYLAFVPK